MVFDEIILGCPGVILWCFFLADKTSTGHTFKRMTILVLTEISPCLVDNFLPSLS